MPDTYDYPAEIARDEDGRYVVGFPDFGWGATDGASRDEALVEAKDLLLERRTKDILVSMLVFGLLVIVVFNFAIDPTGTWVLAENQDSGTIHTFRRDADSGELTHTGHMISIPGPVCIQMMDA